MTIQQTKRQFSNTPFSTFFLCLTFTLFLQACSKSADSSGSTAEEADYFKDSTGVYVVELYDSSYNVYENGVKLKKSTAINQGNYPFGCGGWCGIPNTKERTYIQCMQGMNSRQNFSASLSKTKGNTYRISRKPSFLGGNNMPCYECLTPGVTVEDFYFAICNGRGAFGGSLLEAAQISALNQTLSTVNLTGSQVDQLVSQLEASGAYKCSKR